VSEFYVSANVGLNARLKVTDKHLQLLKGQDLVEEEVARVIFVQHYLALVGLVRTNDCVAELDQHCGVVSVQRSQFLLLPHLLVVKHVACVHVEEKVVSVA